MRQNQEPVAHTDDSGKGWSHHEGPPLRPSEPRYIPFPDELYRLRHRYPCLTESLFMECTRCHQWVAVPVLHEIPDEVISAPVSSSAAGLDVIGERTRAKGPLHHCLQDRGLRRAEGGNSTPQWHSRRLQEKHFDLFSDDGDRESGNSFSKAATIAASESGHSASSNGSATSSSSIGFFQSLLAQLHKNSSPTRQQTAAEAAEPSGNGRTKKCPPPPLYIPNPDTFICSGWQCAWDADTLADLRVEWMKSLYAALPAPSAPLEDVYGLTSSTSVPESLHQRRSALNAALASELEVGRYRRRFRGGQQGPPCRRGGEDVKDALPSLSLPQLLPGGITAEKVEAVGGESSTREVPLSRLHAAWVKAAAARLLCGSRGIRNSNDTPPGAEVDGGTEDATLGRQTSQEEEEEEGSGAMLSAFCWAVCDACGKLRRVAQPFPGGAPFVCAMAVTTSCSCRATLDCEGYSSPNSKIENACSVSEVEGLLQCNMKLSESELMYAALSSPFLPYPLKTQVASRYTCRGDITDEAQNNTTYYGRRDVERVLFGEPLLSTIYHSLDQSLAPDASSPTKRRRRVPSAPTRNVLMRTLPVLRNLARTIKKRGTGTFLRQLLLTPAEIQAKREAVMRNSFLSGVQLKVEEKNSDEDDPGKGASAEDNETVAHVPLSARRVQSSRENSSATDVDGGGGTMKHTMGHLPQVRTPPRQVGLHASPGSPVSSSSATVPIPRSRRTTVPPVSDDRTGLPHPRRQREEEAPSEISSAKELTTEVKEEPPQQRRRRTEGKATVIEPSVVAEVVVVKDDDADEEIAEVTTPAPRRRGRARVRPSESTSEATKSRRTARTQTKPKYRGMDEAAEVVHWVQCDHCSKWRIVPQRISPSVKYWECAMRFDEERGRLSTCDDPEDAE